MADNKKMILNLFAGMQEALFLGDRFENGEFVSFLQPGQFLSLNLKERPNSNDMAIQSEIANILIDSTFVNNYKDINYSGSKELEGSVNQVYYDIMNHVALPKRKMSSEEIRKIKEIEKWIDENQPNYVEYRNQYFDAVEAFDVEAHKQDSDGTKLRRLGQIRRDAYSTWEVRGKKATYEKNLGMYYYLNAEDPITFWYKLNQKLVDQLNRSPDLGEYYHTNLSPSISSWDQGWSSFERQISETDTYEYSKSTSWAGGLSGRWGLWSFGGGASGTTDYKKMTSNVSTVNLKFEYLRVRIDRPWLTADVFNYNFWTWKKDFGGRYISDGGILELDPPTRPIGRMPVLPQYLIVVKNVELSAAFSNEEKDFFSREMSANASVGWGPFSVSGSYRESESTKHFKAFFDNLTFKIPQPQIIARTGILLRKNPDPNLSLPWQDDACLPKDGCFNTELELIKNKRAEDYEFGHESEEFERSHQLEKESQ